MDYKIIMATLAGSQLYGLNTPESDTDIRGVCFNPIESLLGLSGFEQYQPGKDEAEKYGQERFNIKGDDLVIYSLNKFFKLCLDANPNIIELLFSNNLLVSSNIWDEILEHRQSFLSTKIVHTFAGYAYSQLQRIEGHKRWLDKEPQKPDPFDYGMVLNDKGGQDWTSSNLKNAYDNKSKEYQDYREWFDNRNEYRHNLELKFGYDTKHAMHLFRLLIEAKELLTTGNLTLPFDKVTKEFLLGVKNGNLSYEAVVKAGREAKDNLVMIESTLPKFPDRKGIEDLLVKLNKKYLLNLTN